jgi:hypothetical protein
MLTLPRCQFEAADDDVTCVTSLFSIIYQTYPGTLSRARAPWLGEGVNQDEGAPGEALFSLAQLRGQAAAAAAEQVLRRTRSTRLYRHCASAT